ncbi:MAG: hypothetical protein ACJ760_13740, partial [Thermoleophilaceae bacterium]
GQGRNNVKAYLRENPNLTRELEEKIYAALGVESRRTPIAPVPDAGADGEPAAAENGGPPATAAAEAA